MTTAPAPLTAYSDLSEEEQNLYCQIQDMFGSDWTHEEVMEFIEELDDYGIDTSENLEDAFTYVSDTAYTEDGAKADFAEYWFCEVMERSDAYDDVVVDWTSTYDYALRFDISIIEFKGDYFFFHNNY